MPDMRRILMTTILAAMAVPSVGCLGGLGDDGGDSVATDDGATDDGATDGLTDDGATDDGATDDDGPPIVGEPPDLVGITAAHNTLRAAHGVGPMAWNEELEALAAGFVADCVFAHSSQGERSGVAGFDYIGENLYSSGGFKPTGPDVSAAWASEEADYDYASNSCSGVCGHYTQQVWADSTELGCAIQACPGNSYIVSCEYGPGGNFNGQPPY